MFFIFYFLFFVCIQIPVLSFLFLILFLGNTLTTSMVIPQKLRDKVRLKYRFTRLDKYFSTYTKGGRRYTLSGNIKLFYFILFSILYKTLFQIDRSRSNESQDASQGAEMTEEEVASSKMKTKSFEDEKDQ